MSGSTQRPPRLRGRSRGAVIALGAACLLQAIAATAATATTDVSDAVAEARELSRQHRYQQALQLLARHPVEGLARADRHAVCAETGRALFHLGRYREARSSLRCAIRARPESAETALYLLAASYLTGERDHALAILDELLRSGARDLFLVVTLAGERRFLADAEVWSILTEHSVPAEVDVESGGALNVQLGASRDEALAALPVTGAEIAPGPVVVARAGPHVVWMLRFVDDRVTEILLQVEMLSRYTPYRVRLAPGLSWRSGPDEAALLLGPPDERRRDRAGGVHLTWHRPRFDLRLAFGPPSEPVPAGVARDRPVLQVVDLARRDP